MNFNLKKISILAAGIALVGALFYAAQFIRQEKAITPQLTERFNLNAFDAVTTKEDYLSTLAQEETALWQQLQAVIGITKEECIALKNQPDWIIEYKELVNKMVEKYKDTTSVSQEHQDLAIQLLQKFDINPETITIAPWNELSPAGSTDMTLFINEELFEPMPLLVKKFILAHEINHIINKDHSTDFVIAKLKEMNNIESEQFTTTINVFSQFVETRADTLASLYDPEYAQGHIMFAEHELLGSNPEYEDYPSDAARFELGKQILAMHTL